MSEELYQTQAEVPSVARGNKKNREKKIRFKKNIFGEKKLNFLAFVTQVTYEFPQKNLSQFGPAVWIAMLTYIHT